MESRIYATILLIAFGIIQTHSHPKGRDALREFSESGNHQSSISEPLFGHSIGSNFLGDLGDDRVYGRVRRERKLVNSAILERLYKLNRFDTGDAHRAYNANLQELFRILDRYVERGLTVEEAVRQLGIHHLNLANRAVEDQHGVI